MPVGFIFVTSHTLTNVANALPGAGGRRYPPRRFIPSPPATPTAPLGSAFLGSPSCHQFHLNLDQPNRLAHTLPSGGKTGQLLCQSARPRRQCRPRHFSGESSDPTSDVGERISTGIPQGSGKDTLLNGSNHGRIIETLKKLAEEQRLDDIF